MNTNRKGPIITLLCDKCDDIYMRIGDEYIRLAHPRKVTPNPITGMPYTGVCPKHRSNT